MLAVVFVVFVVLIFSENITQKQSQPKITYKKNFGSKSSKRIASNENFIMVDLKREKSPIIRKMQVVVSKRSLTSGDQHQLYNENMKV